jgi:hypothetical protein
LIYGIYYYYPIKIENFNSAATVTLGRLFNNGHFQGMPMTTSRCNLLKADTSTLIGGLLASAGRAVSAKETTPAATGYVKGRSKNLRRVALAVCDA